MSEQITTLIVETIKQLDLEQELGIGVDLSRETSLFGMDGILDSMTLVTVVVAVEQALEEEHGTTVSLADAKAMSQTNSPYRTIGSLAAYATKVVQEKKASD